MENEDKEINVEEEQQAYNVFRDELEIAKMWADDIKKFVVECALEWQLVESIQSPTVDVRELRRKFANLLNAFKYAAENSPNKRHPNNPFQEKE